MRGRILTGPDGSTLYVTVDGDMVDAIAHAYYGKHEQHTEEIYAMNPAIADMDITLPAGTVLKLPAIKKQETPKPFRQLWN